MTRVDVVGVTLYPWLNFATAASVPAGYLDSLWARIGSKPIAITETGWPAEDFGLSLPWETTESAQVTLSVVTGHVWAMTKSEAAPAPATFDRVAVEELKPLADHGEVTIIDVRDSEAYVASHIPSALHIPLARLEGEVPYLPKGKPVVTYCSCPAEETSGQAAILLRRFGFEAKALLGGFDAWNKLQFPTAAGVQ